MLELMQWSSSVRAFIQCVDLPKASSITIDVIDRLPVSIGGEQESGVGGVLKDSIVVLHVDLLPTQRESRVSRQPAVNAVDVERMLAPGQQAKELRTIEPKQANDAFKAIPHAAQLRELEHEKRLNRGLVDARQPTLRKEKSVVSG